MSDRVIMGANWYVDSLNCRKRLSRCQLPRLAKARESFIAGGGFFRMSMPTEIEELEASFSVKGSHDDIRGLFGREMGDETTFFYYERLRDLIQGRDYGRVVTLKGLVQEVEQPSVTGKNAELTNYRIGSIVMYDDITDGKRVHKMDFHNNELWMNGINYSEAHNRLIAA